jgi:Tfp pilus assembly protein PilV
VRNQRGLSFVAVLVAMLIAAALYFGYFKMQDSMSGRSTGMTAINASRAVACRTQRQSIERNIVFWSVNHDGETPTFAALEADGFHIPSCPDGGHYELVGREVHCSKHP